MKDNNTEFVEHCREQGTSRLGNKIVATIFTGAGIFLITYCFRPWLWLPDPWHKPLFLGSVFFGLTVSVIGCIFGLIEIVKHFAKRSEYNDFEAKQDNFDENEL